jgi:hypothetical protein
MEGRCVCCGGQIKRNPRVKIQRYCSRPECQKARRKVWQQQKLEKDEDYRRNQADAQRRWRECHRDYWRQYRESRPEYVHRNRELQRERNRRRRKVPDQSAGGCKEIAKMDAFGGAMSFASGLYRLTPVDPPGIAKMDALTVRLALICPVAGGGVR